MSVTRRDLLRGITAGAALTFADQAGATPQPPRRIVGTRSQAAVEHARDRASGVIHVLDFGPIGQAVAGRFSGRAVRELAERDDVRYIERDGRRRLVRRSLPWGVDRIDADVAHGSEVTGAGADIAIIDTGIDSDHPALQDTLREGTTISRRTACHGRPSVCREPWDDEFGHGTHVAGIAAATDTGEGVVGVAPDATLHAVDIFMSGGTAFNSDSAAGITWVADQEYDVANMSYGGSESRVENDALEYAASRGVLLVAAAGNAGPCTDCVIHPASHPEVIAVSATDINDEVASFSSTGPDVELAAPGVDILSTVPGGSYATLSGTSMASPHVAGAGALLMAEGDNRMEARDKLTETAEDIGRSPDERGAGLVDAAAALGLDSSENLALHVR